MSDINKQGCHLFDLHGTDDTQILNLETNKETYIGLGKHSPWKRKRHKEEINCEFRMSTISIELTIQGP
jgi:hypothetical protein